MAKENSCIFYIKNVPSTPCEETLISQLNSEVNAIEHYGIKIQYQELYLLYIHREIGKQFHMFRFGIKDFFVIQKNLNTEFDTSQNPITCFRLVQQH